MTNSLIQCTLMNLLKFLLQIKSANHFVCIKKCSKSLLKQRIPVDICIDDRQIVDELTGSIASSAFLRVATERWTSVLFSVL